MGLYLSESDLVETVCDEVHQNVTVGCVTVIVAVQPFERSYTDNPGPMVVFATPGMLHGGLSLQIFKKWCVSENNMVYMLYSFILCGIARFR